MPHGRAIANESKYLFIVELLVDTGELSVELDDGFPSREGFRSNTEGELLEKANPIFVGAFMIWRRRGLIQNSLAERSTHQIV
jgi:hypothetical protein